MGRIIPASLLAAFDVPAAIQAGAAVVIAALTLFLVRATTKYVSRTDAMVTQMARANDLTEENLARIARKNAARLVVQAAGRSTLDDGWEFKYRVTNLGEGAAHDASLGFEFDQRTLDTVIPPEGGAMASLTVPFERLPKDSRRPEHPRVQLAHFMDSSGDWWEQAANPDGSLRPPHPLLESSPRSVPLTEIRTHLPP